MAERVRLKYTPRYDGPIEGFVVNFIRKNIWRVPSYLTEEDLMQESHLLFWKLKTLYTQVDNPKWFMTLYKTAFSNRINDLSNRKSKSVDECLESDMGEDVEIAERHSGGSNEGYFHVLLDQVPQDVRTALNFLDSCHERVYEQLKGDVNLSNSLLCSWMGLDPKKVNIFAKTKSYFS